MSFCTLKSQKLVHGINIDLLYALIDSGIYGDQCVTY